MRPGLMAVMTSASRGSTPLRFTGHRTSGTRLSGVAVTSIGPHRRADGNGQHGGDDNKRNIRRQMNFERLVYQQHLEPDEGEDDPQAHVEVAEPALHPTEEEV